MARFTIGPLIHSIRGSIGGLTFRNDKAGGTMYERPPSKNIVSASLQEHKQIVSQANKDWASLNQAQKQFWNEAAKLEQSLSNIRASVTTSGRLFFLGWRIRGLHAHVTYAATLQPPAPIYYYYYPRVVLFAPGLGFQYYGAPLGAIPPFPRSACWMSWSPNGSAAAGRTYKKIWPQPGHYNNVNVVDGDSLVYAALGIPPEWRPQVSGYYPQKTPVLIRHYRCYPNGRIATALDYPAWAPGNQFYFKEPPDTPVFSGIAF